MDEKKKKVSGQQGELMRTLDISIEDIEANNEGYITEEQQASVLKRQGYRWRQHVILTIVFTLFGTLLPGIILAAEGAENARVVAGISLFFLMVATGFGVYGYWNRNRLQKELSEHKIATIQGIAVVTNTLEQSYIEVNGLKLHAPADAVKRIRHLDPYIVHYTTDSKTILSMEHIDDDDNIRESSARLQESDSSEDMLIVDDDEAQMKNYS